MDIDEPMKMTQDLRDAVMEACENLPADDDPFWETSLLGKMLKELREAKEKEDK